MSKEIRFKTLDECFRHPIGITKREIIDKVLMKLLEKKEDPGYTIRTFEKDVSDMKFLNSDFKENLEKGSLFKDIDGKRKKVFRYADRSFSYYDSELNSREKDLIKKAVNFLFKIDTKSLTWLDEITNGLDIFRDDNEEKVIFFDERQKEAVEHSFKLIYNAIIEKNPISFFFRKVNSHRSEKYLVSPYFLKQFDQKWYLFGKRHFNSKAEIERFPLARIVPGSTEIRGDLGIIPTQINFEEYFQNKYGVGDFGKNPEVIILKIKKSLYERITDKPIHPSQYLLRDKKAFEDLFENKKSRNKVFKIPSEKEFANFLFLFLKVEISPNLSKLLLSYGSELMVMYPFKLLKSQRSKIQAMLENYKAWSKSE
jgi:predicted DNA-binding transcriptional regulator YafY